MSAPVAPVAAPPAAPVDTRDALSRAIDEARSHLSADRSVLTVETADPVVDTPVDPDVVAGEDVEAEEEASPQEVVEEEQQEEAPSAPLTEDATSVVLTAEDGKQRKLVFGTPEDAELVRQHIAGSMLRGEYHDRLAQVEERDDELALARDAITVDPVGFVLEQLPESMRRELAIALLLQPGVLDADLQQVANTWLEDPDAAELARLKIGNARAETRDDLVRKFEARQASRTVLKLTSGVIDTIGENLIANRDLRATFDQDMIDEVKRWGKAYIAKHGALPALKAEHIVEITQRRLAVYGIKPDDAKKVLDPARRPTPPRARPTGAAAEQIAATAEAARKTGTRFVAGAAARKVAAVVPGGGGTAAPTKAENLPPKGQTVSERTNWFRKNMPGLWRKA